MTDTKDIPLKIIGHDDSIDKPNEKGFYTVRFFGKGNGSYKISYWNGRKDNPVLWKIRKDSKSYIMIRKETVQDLRDGHSVLVDNDILSI